jgi:hypothetical protein
MTMKHIFISRVVEGKIVEVWGVGDISDVWQQRLQRERIERERVEQELQVARRIQQASLPKEVPALEGWQIAPYYQPAREVGGDFYDFLELADGRLGVVVGDATGKGVPACQPPLPPDRPRLAGIRRAFRRCCLSWPSWRR